MRAMYVPFVCSLLMPAVTATAQEFRATLTGVISDAQDARIPAAAIKVTQSTTGAKFSTVSTASGQYAVPLLPPGIYNVVVEAAGFKTICSRWRAAQH